MANTSFKIKMFYFCWFVIKALLILSVYFIGTQISDDNGLAAFKSLSEELSHIRTLKPVYVDGQNFIGVNKSYVLGCPETNGSKPVMWLKNGWDIDESNIHSRHFKYGPLLVFTPAVVKDTGFYQCYQNDKLLATTHLCVITTPAHLDHISDNLFFIIVFTYFIQAAIYFTCCYGRDEPTDSNGTPDLRNFTTVTV